MAASCALNGIQDAMLNASFDAGRLEAMTPSYPAVLPDCLINKSLGAIDRICSA
jgi:hypothetical protein